jgi:HEAT repeat protein
VAVLAALRDRSGASPSAALYRAIGAVGGVEDVDLLRVGLRRDSVAQRVAAVTAVAALAQRGQLHGVHVQELVAAVSDPAWPVRSAAARAFVELARANAGTPGGASREQELPVWVEALGALKQALRDPEEAVRAAAVEALGACARPEHTEAIIALVEGGEAAPVVVAAALHALGAGTPPPASLVLRAAAHRDPEVVKEAVLAAARLPGPEGERVLRDAAGSERWDVRQTAARAMAERGDRALAAEAAQRAASDPDPLVARAFAEAARVLGEG